MKAEIKTVTSLEKGSFQDTGGIILHKCFQVGLLSSCWIVDFILKSSRHLGHTKQAMYKCSISMSESFGIFNLWFQPCFEKLPQMVQLLFSNCVFHV